MAHAHFRNTVALLAAALLGTAAARAEPHALPSRHVPASVADGTAIPAGQPAPEARIPLAVSLPLRNEAALDALLADLYDPSSPNFRHYLTVADFTDHFGPRAADYAATLRYLRSQGLHVDAAYANRSLVAVSGRVADIERVFHVRLQLWRHPGEPGSFMAPDREPSIDLPVAIQHVTGLDNEHPARPRLVHAAETGRAGSGSGPGGYFIGTDVRKAYYPTGSLLGRKQSLGLMELAGYNIKDVNTFFAKYGPANSVKVVGIKTDGASLSCTGSCDDSEQALDIEYAIAMAPGLKQVQVYVGNLPEHVLARMASDDTSKQLSTSWGWDENFATDDGLFKEMAAQGQSLLTASGDYSSLQASGPWPEEDANITAVGGTDLVTSGAGGPWSQETGWSGSAGGPSLDKTITIESYQLPFINSANNGSTTLRNVPDIAAVADNFTICADGGCSGGYAGTSFASPIWTGFIALANQHAADIGKPPVGWLNPTLYLLAGNKKYTSLFHDIVSGKSGVYSCTPSYDLVTGVGAPQGTALIDKLVSP